MKKFDVIIVGGGPGGAACALQLLDSNLSVAVIDKESFPRDKTCGDALSTDVLNQLSRLPLKVEPNFEKIEDRTPCYGTRVFAPNAECLDISFPDLRGEKVPGYIVKRIDFDNFMFDQLRNEPNITLFEGEKVTEIITNNKGVYVTTTNHSLEGQIIIGADGAHSIVSKKLSKIKIDKDHYCAGLRVYYENVEGFSEGNHIELHFYNDILPGYFWMFPLANGQANIGLGMLSSEIQKKNVNIKKELEKIITTHPKIAPRFKNAKPLEKVKGYGLPLGSQKYPISGDRFMLVGDAACLIDPASGEGVGNAIRSGRFAADYIKKSFESHDFSGEMLKAYDKFIYKKMGPELQMSRSLQKLINYPWLVNFVVKKAQNNESVQLLFKAMLQDVNLQKQLLKPSFYFKLLFK